MAVFLPSLKKRGHLDRLHITICNVGSRKISHEDDYEDLGWSIFAPNLTIYGFDADADACEIANAELAEQQISWTEQHIPLALSDTVGDQTLYVTKAPMCSSLYPPNEPYLARLEGLSELVNLDFTIDIETTTLETFCAEAGIETIDFLQIDVQGADLQVLKGASRLLERSVLAVQVEVEFSPLYVGQPLFADVDSYLRTRDFTLFDLMRSYRVRSQSPVMSRMHPGQLLWADAFYFCDLLQDTEMQHLRSPEQLLKLACIADALHFPDYALELLQHLTLTYGRKDSDYNFADLIVESLLQVSNLSKENLVTLPAIRKIQDYLTQPIF